MPQGKSQKPKEPVCQHCLTPSGRTTIGKARSAVEAAQAAKKQVETEIIEAMRRRLMQPRPPMSQPQMSQRPQVPMQRPQMQPQMSPAASMGANQQAHAVRALLERALMHGR